jgi:probable HAF family extracellular repeat protein
VDLGDLVLDGQNWYETRVMALGENDTVAGQTTVANVTFKGAFLWDGVSMTYLGMHGDAGTPLDDWDLYNRFDSGGDPKPFIYSEGVAIGPNGDVVCNSTTGTNWPDETEKRAFHYDVVTGVQTDLPPYQFHDPATDRGQFSEAFDMNANYVVFNREEKKGEDIIANAWPLGGAINGPGIVGADSNVFIAQILGAGIVEPVAINDADEAITNSLELTVVFDDINTGGFADLGALTGLVTVGAAINDHPGTGHVAGTTGNKAFFWDGGSMVSCGDLGGGTSEATDINNSDVVIGNSTTAGGDTHAFSWRLVNGVGVMTDLGTLGGANSWAVDINNNGLIVGKSETGATYTEGGVTYNVVHACAWYNNVIYDLGIHSDFYAYSLANPFPFSEAIAVNDNNRIAGNSYSPNEHYRGFILDSPVP